MADPVTKAHYQQKVIKAKKETAYSMAISEFMHKKDSTCSASDPDSPSVTTGKAISLPEYPKTTLLRLKSPTKLITFGLSVFS